MSTPEALSIHQHRGALVRARSAIQKGKITLGFIGGSITDGRGPHNWTDPVGAWFARTFPGVRVCLENAAIGATNSGLGTFRAKRDLIDRGCDLVFVEYAVNDNGETEERRQRTREGLLRQLLREERDVVLVYTYMQDMYKEMSEGRVPASVAGLEALGAHYCLGSVWMGLAAMLEVRSGAMRWQEWLPDGLHPNYRGSFRYAASVCEFLERELVSKPSTQKILCGKELPEPVDPLCWERVGFVPWDSVKTEGPFTLRRATNNVWMDQVLFTPSPGARLSFEFDGRGLVLGFDFGKQAAEFRYRLDGGDPVEVVRDRPAWCGDQGWFRLYPITDSLPPGRHRLELTVTHGNRAECTGSDFSMAFAGVIG
jgi:lysophospholipase L1-like esterase